jgi:hypothetical protein
MENASAAFLTAVQRSMQMARSAIGSDAVDPAALSCAELRQHSGWLRREEENTAILALAKQGVALKEIVRRTGKSADSGHRDQPIRPIVITCTGDRDHATRLDRGVPGGRHGVASGRYH